MPLAERPHPRRRRSRPPPAPDKPALSAERLTIDLTTVADVEGLKDEVSMLRAAIRRLAVNGKATRHVKRLAELRHQVDTLCTALKTQRALDGRDSDALSADLAGVLEEIGDEMGLPQ